jgi:hypothetical protein
LFKREFHVRIATVLQTLNAEVLARHRCYFGGGTAIVLLRDEYRESIDIDFIVSDKAGYRFLRQSINNEVGLAAIARPGTTLTLAREIISDQYGIRTFLKVGNTEIKFEIVLEGRIELEMPESATKICGVAALSEIDMATTKILANSDRLADDAVYSRDLIDLAMLQLPRTRYKQALEKAKTVYADTAERDLHSAIDRLKERPGRLGECMIALKMDSIPEAVLWSRIRTLR